MEYFELNNGVSLPALGTGTNTFGRDDDDLRSAPTGNFTAMEDAIRCGYELFDCAMSYGNEEGLGTCLAESGIPRERFSILNKIRNSAPYNVSPESVRQCVKDSLARMRTDYYDLFLVHQAIDPEIAKVGGSMDVERTVALYHELEHMYEEGVFRAIGVANFNKEQLEVLIENCSIVPAVNQIRYNPACRNIETVEFCKDNGIIPMAHSPLNFEYALFKVDEAKKAEYRAKASEIGEKYGKSWVQVLLRWNYQYGVCSIPKSSNPANQKANLDIFDFELTQDEMDSLF